MKERRDFTSRDYDDARLRDTDISSSDGRSIKQILQDIVNHVSDILRSEVRLAKTEIQQDVSDIAKAGKWIAAAGILGLYALGFVLLSAVYGLQTVVPPWLAPLIVGAAVGILAGILYVTGRKKVSEVSRRPVTTIESVKENITWLKKQTK